MGDGGAESLAYFAVGSHKQERSMALHAWFKIAICHFDFTGSYIYARVSYPSSPSSMGLGTARTACCLLYTYLVVYIPGD